MWLAHSVPPQASLTPHPPASGDASEAPEVCSGGEPDVVSLPACRCAAPANRVRGGRISRQKGSPSMDAYRPRSGLQMLRLQVRVPSTGSHPHLRLHWRETRVMGSKESDGIKRGLPLPRGTLFAFLAPVREPSLGRWRAWSLLHDPLAFDGAVDGSAADSENLHQVGDGVLAGSLHAGQFGLLTGGQLGFLSPEPALGVGDGHAFAGAEPKQVDLEFGECGQDVEEHLAEGIGGVVDGCRRGTA